MERTATAVRDVAARTQPVFEADERVRFAYLFGSAARGTSTVRSDIDLAVYLTGDVTLTDEARLQGELADALGSPVDAVVLNRAPLWLQFRVLGKLSDG